MGGFRAVLRRGLTAAILDNVAAFVVYGFRGATPIQILQSIASGLLGVEAFRGGLVTAALGLLLHFVIAFGWAGVYCGASRRLRVLSSRPVLSGMAYGAAVYLMMNFVVVPLSAVPKRPFVLEVAVVILVVHMVCVGLPIALAVRRYAPNA
jgi:hypothetical protein